VATPLLTTKLYLPPTRPNRVPRPRLTTRLNESHPLTLVAAPAGFGKTTTLSEWIPKSQHCVTWLSLDDADNDPTRFWMYVISALQKLRADLGESALALLQSPQPPPIMSILTTLINEIADFPESFSLVLDDYHLITTQPIHEALAFLLDHLPPHVRVIVTTRADPPLPLARLRARDQLTELRADDLRFTPDEATQFLNQVMGLTLSAGDIAALEARTEGWVAGLQLAALSMQGRDDTSNFIEAFSGSHRHVLTYLIEEVLDRRPQGTLNFLLQTSILDRLCGPLCEAVTESADGQATLEKLEQANLFIAPLDDEGRWYRYHHLFADVLRNRLRQTQPDQTPELHRRASGWFERNGLTSEAIQQALAAKDFERAAQLIEDQVQAASAGLHAYTAQAWLNALPRELRQTRPRLLLAEAWAGMGLGQVTGLEENLLAVEALLAEMSPESARPLRGEIAALRAMFLSFRAEFAGTINFARQALADLPADNEALRLSVMVALATAYSQLGYLAEADQIATMALASRQFTPELLGLQSAVTVMLGMTRVVQTRLRDALMLLQQAVALLERQGRPLPLATTAFARYELGLLLYELNALGEAEPYMRGALEICQAIGHPLLQAYVQAGLAHLTQTVGDAGAAAQNMERAVNLARSLNLPATLRVIEAYQTHLWLRQGSLGAAVEWAGAYAREPEDQTRPLTPLDFAPFALARVWLAQGRTAEVMELLARLHHAAEAVGNRRAMLWALMLQALTRHAQSRNAEALATLEQALTIAEPEGYVRLFVDEGEPMRLLISDFRLKIDDGRLRAYADQLLAAFPNPLPVTNIQSPILQSSLVEPLSDRELGVLRLLASGLSDRAIAEKLVLAIGTVKKHLNNIYGKLGAHTRTQALVRAKELNLL